MEKCNMISEKIEPNKLIYKYQDSPSNEVFVRNILKRKNTDNYEFFRVQKLALTCLTEN